MARGRLKLHFGVGRRNGRCIDVLEDLVVSFVVLGVVGFNELVALVLVVRLFALVLLQVHDEVGYLCWHELPLELLALSVSSMLSFDLHLLRCWPVPRIRVYSISVVYRVVVRLVLGMVIVSTTTTTMLSTP